MSKKKHDYLFDIDCYKKGQILWQVRIAKIDDMDDQGEILATFLHHDHCGLMAGLAFDKEVYKLMIIEYEVGNGIIDAYDLDQIMCYKLHLDVKG